MVGEIAAAGAVVWRGSGDEIVLVHRPRYDDWSLPKGKLSTDEAPRCAAIREVAEETGQDALLGRFLGQVRYPVADGLKTVDYYAARAAGGHFEPSDEVDEVRWCSVQKARKLLSYRHDVSIVDAFTALPAALTTLLIVRHAKAGSQREWRDADELRPLSKNGQRQVSRLRALAALYGPDRVYAAPLVRCVDTVRPAACDAGVDVVEEPLLSEKSYRGHEGATVRRLLSLAVGGGVSVVCSQGGVIPDLVSRVAGAAGLPLRHVESKKGSVWALFFASGTLVAADYIVP